MAYKRFQCEGYFGCVEEDDVELFFLKDFSRVFFSSLRHRRQLNRHDQRNGPRDAV